jgi:hypothetical protein
MRTRRPSGSAEVMVSRLRPRREYPTSPRHVHGNPLGPVDATAHGTGTGRASDGADRGAAQWAAGARGRMTSRLRDKSQRHLHDAEPTRYCQPCRKFSYISRAAARKRRTLPNTTTGPNAYRCPDNTGWHLGHLREDEHSTDHHRAASSPRHNRRHPDPATGLVTGRRPVAPDRRRLHTLPARPVALPRR